MAIELGQFVSEQLTRLPSDHPDREYLEGVKAMNNLYLRSCPNGLERAIPALAKEDEIIILGEETTTAPVVDDEIIIIGEELTRQPEDDIFVIIDEMSALPPQGNDIVIRYRDTARNPIEWVTGAIRDAKECFKKTPR